jgi:hypothetical protein
MPVLDIVRRNRIVNGHYVKRMYSFVVINLVNNIPHKVNLSLPSSF